MEAIMRMGTKELIFRLTAAAIGFAATGAVFHVAVAHSQEAEIIVQDTARGGFETPASNQADRLSDRQQLRFYFLDGRDRLR
jgi:hypothetical protein